jgi:tetratricopeptide (TPR) repeat protein
LNFIENLNLARTHLIIAYNEIGEYGKAKDHCDELIFMAKQAGFGPSRINYIKTCSALTKVLENKKQIDLESLYEYVEDNKLKLIQISMRRDIGEILLNLGDKHLSEAEDWLKKAIEASKRSGMMWYVGMDYALYAELFKRKGDQLKAKETLSKAIQIFKECGADGWVKKYEEELSELA